MKGNRRTVAILASVILTAVVAGTIWVTTAASGTRDRSATAFKLALAGVSLQHRDPELSLLLGATAVRIDPDPLVRSALINSLMARRQRYLAGSVDVRAAALSADGRTAVTSDLVYGVLAWRLPDRRPVEDEGDVDVSPSFGMQDFDAGEVALSADGSFALVGASDASVQVWDLTKLKKPRLLATVKGGRSWDRVDRLIITPDGKTALVSRYSFETAASYVSVLDVTDKSHPVESSSLSSETTSSRANGMDATGKVVVTLGKAAAVVWDISDPSSPKEVARLRRTGTAEWESVALGPGGNVLVIGTGDGAVVWDLSSKVQVGAFAQGTGVVVRMSAISDRSTVLIRQGLHSVGLWELADPSHPFKVAELGGIDSFARALALSRDGMTAFAGVGQGSGLWWNLAGISGDPLRDLCRDGKGLSGLVLDKDLWARYVGDGWDDFFGDVVTFQPCSDSLKGAAGSNVA